MTAPAFAVPAAALHGTVSPVSSTAPLSAPGAPGNPVPAHPPTG